MTGDRPVIRFGFAAVLLGASVSVFAATPRPLSGSIAGEVKATTGIAQMGATVILYNRLDRPIRQVLTDVRGSFLFDSLIPDLYSIRVSLPSFVPAFKKNISIQPGFHSVLTINLASMLSSIELVSSTPVKGALMTEDWKWVLRSSQATRPVVRFREDSAESKPRFANVFSETRGIVKVSAGDGVTLSGAGAQPDLGTAFALATSLFGSNQLQVSGNVGIASHTGMPTAGFRTTYSRTNGRRSPEFTVTMRQLYLPTRGGFGTIGGDGAPALRTLAATTIDEISILTNLRFEYGASAETVSLVDRLNMISPFARLTYELGPGSTVQVAYSNGSSPIELASRTSNSLTAREHPELHNDLTALAALPRVSLRDGHARVQRTENTEVGFTKTARSRTFSVGAFRERTANGALLMSGPDDVFDGNVLPDLSSKSGVFNIGNFNRWGYLASVSQGLGEKLEVSAAFGRGGALTTARGELSTTEANELRSIIRMAQKSWAVARVSGTAPVLGTRFAASYGWSDHRALMPGHLFMTQRLSTEPGVNITIRQPLPSMGGVPGRFEATAELRNLLEQGYLPVTSSDGRALVLTNAPRAVRGGLSFIF